MLIFDIQILYIQLLSSEEYLNWRTRFSSCGHLGSNKINRVNEITYGEEAEDLGLSLEGTEGEKDEGFPGGSVVKHPSANAGDTGSIPGLGRSPGAGNGSPLQYSCLENPMDRGASCTTAHRAAKESDRTYRLNNNNNTCTSGNNCNPLQIHVLQIFSARCGLSFYFLFKSKSF